MCVATTKSYVEILNFRHFAKHFLFSPEGKNSRDKHLKNYFDVSVDYLLGRTNTRSKKDNSKVALDDNDIIMTWRGQPLSDEDREMIKRIMNGKD